jgi:hypothetical protein
MWINSFSPIYDDLQLSKSVAMAVCVNGWPLAREKSTAKFHGKLAKTWVSLLNFIFLCLAFAQLAVYLVWSKQSREFPSTKGFEFEMITSAYCVVEHSLLASISIEASVGDREDPTEQAAPIALSLGCATPLSWPRQVHVVERQVFWK